MCVPCLRSKWFSKCVVAVVVVADRRSTTRVHTPTLHWLKILCAQVKRCMHAATEISNEAHWVFISFHFIVRSFFFLKHTFNNNNISYYYISETLSTPALKRTIFFSFALPINILHLLFSNTWFFVAVVLFDFLWVVLIQLWFAGCCRCMEYIEHCVHINMCIAQQPTKGNRMKRSKKNNNKNNNNESHGAAVYNRYVLNKNCQVFFFAIALDNCWTTICTWGIIERRCCLERANAIVIVFVAVCTSSERTIDDNDRAKYAS